MRLDDDWMAETLADLESRVPGYERSLEAIDAHIAQLSKMSHLFSWLPPLESGGHAKLVPAIEDRCRKSVLRELRKCRSEIVAHLERVRACRVDA